jgi:alanyl-tRNA synthetase
VPGRIETISNHAHPTALPELMDADQLRSRFLGYFAERDHHRVPSASLVPRDPSVMFTIAGMLQFKPYFTREMQPPWPRATSVQKCFRTVDIDQVGISARHDTFFEMLGNFSFGDYFKERAIALAFEFVTEVLGLDPGLLWVTVHETDDEAEGIWLDTTSIPAGRIQRMREDNWWASGETGPCGPDSEIFVDKGAAYGVEGGPAHGGEERFVELWNLVFMQFNRLPDGSLVDLPTKNIDTGMGLERALTVLEGVDTVFDTDVFAPLVQTAERLLGVDYGTELATDIAIRRLADHGRAVTMLITDGVLPSNDGRGYVLRRLVRRAVLAARRLGVERSVMSTLAETTTEVMSSAYPALSERLDLARSVLEREEAAFDRTLRAGLGLLRGAMDAARREERATLDGEVAFRLHDTHGFPVELTEELAGEAGLAVDRAVFDQAMAAQRERARAAARIPVLADEAAYRALLDQHGESDFVGRSPETYATPARVVGVLAGTKEGTAEIFLDRTPFYAEGGGQVGDAGTIVTETGRAEVFDTVAPLPGLHAHRARVEGEIFVGQEALAAIDAGRREATRRNHTGTHLLHAALRGVLGDHVHQQGSYVGPDRLRFDFSHHEAPPKEELVAVLEMANTDVISDDEVVTTETTLAEAEAEGAMAFFGDKYGDVVRMVRAGPHSLELCGGTHVHALGEIGPISIISEGSIGSNTRRIEAVTGVAALSRTLRRERQLEEAARLLRTEPDGLIETLERLLERQREGERALSELRRHGVEEQARILAAGARDGVVVARRDGLAADELRSLAQAVLRADGVRAAVVGGVSGERVALAAATGGTPDANALVKELGAMLGGSGGGQKELAVAGGRDPSRLDEALVAAERALRAR